MEGGGQRAEEDEEEASLKSRQRGIKSRRSPRMRRNRSISVPPDPGGPAWGGGLLRRLLTHISYGAMLGYTLGLSGPGSSKRCQTVAGIRCFPGRNSYCSHRRSIHGWVGGFVWGGLIPPSDRCSAALQRRSSDTSVGRLASPSHSQSAFHHRGVTLAYTHARLPYKIDGNLQMGTFVC